MQLVNEIDNPSKQTCTLQFDMTEEEQRVLIEVGLRKVLIDTIKVADNYEQNEYVIIPTKFQIRKRVKQNTTFAEFEDTEAAQIYADASGIKTMFWGEIDAELISTVNHKLKELQELFELNNISFKKDA